MICDICIRDYNSRRFRPVVGSCGHTFCHSCSKRFQGFLCPTCRGCSFNRPPSNFALLTMINQKNGGVEPEEEEEEEEVDEFPAGPGEPGPPDFLIFLIVSISCLLLLPLIPFVLIASFGYCLFYLSWRFLKIFGSCVYYVFFSVFSIVFLFYLILNPRRLHDFIRNL